MIYVPKYKNEFSEDAKMLVEENGEVFKADMPKQEMPEFKEEVSEDAKMLVEDGGKICKTAMPSGGNGLGFDVVINGVYEGNTLECTLIQGDYNNILEKLNNKLPIFAIVVRHDHRFENKDCRWNVLQYANEWDNNDYISFIGEDNSSQYMIYADNSVVYNSIG